MSLQHKIENALHILRAAETDFAPAAFASSFGAEDMVLTDLVARYARGIEVVTLDTGRLPQETYELMRRTADHYGLRIRVVFPQSRAVEDYVSRHGVNAFYESVELRRQCCEVRKLEPLRRALAGKRAWLTGLRREQAVTRRDLPLTEYDEGNRLYKFNPLADWNEAEVWAYIRDNDVPYNALHDRGYPSIGCAPCTRAVAEGEDVRAGRWWWEDPAHKECGLHRQAPARREAEAA